MKDGHYHCHSDYGAGRFTVTDGRVTSWAPILRRWLFDGKKPRPDALERLRAAGFDVRLEGEVKP